MLRPWPASQGSHGHALARYVSAFAVLSLWHLSSASDGGAALYFDGLDDWAAVFPGFDLLTDWTVELWVQPASPITTGDCIFSFQTLAGDNLLALTSTPSEGYQVLFGVADVGIPEAALEAPNRFNGLYRPWPTQVAITHEALSATRSELSLYVNSTLEATWNVSTSSTIGNIYYSQGDLLPFTLGACYFDGESTREQHGRGLFRGQHFHGHIDEVRWWDVKRNATEVAETWVFSGDPLMWPVPGTTVPTNANSGKTVEPTNASVVAQADEIHAQYSFDFIDNTLLDGSGNGLHGWRGSGTNQLDQPEYESSVFSEVLRLGAAYQELRASATTVVNFEVVILGHFLLGAQSYSGLLVVDGLSNTRTDTTIRGSQDAVGSDFSTGTIVSGLSVTITTGTNYVPDSFSVQPCRGTPGQTPNVSDCSDERVYPVTFSVTSSTPPYAGPGYALQLLQEGSFARLPRPVTPSFTVEFSLQLTRPFYEGAAIFSIQRRDSAPLSAKDPLLLRLNPSSGRAVLEMCTTSGGAVEVNLDAIDTQEPQHLAMSFDYRAIGTGFYYNVSIYQDCRLLARVIVNDPCYTFDSDLVYAPTIGQRYEVSDIDAYEEPWSLDFCPMYLAELRMWSAVRRQQDVCDFMSARLNGNETQLFVYNPVLLEDSVNAAEEAIVAIEARAALGLQVREVIAGSSFRLTSALITDSFNPPTMEVVCSADVGVCPDAERGIGWQIREGVFSSFPPEVTVVETIKDVNGQATFYASDLDNLVHHLVLPLEKDTMFWEIVDFPQPTCVRIFKQTSRIGIATPFDDPCCTRAAFGLAAVETITTDDLPLQLVPFGGATDAEIANMSDICSTSFTYRAVDSTGQDSARLATVSFRVFLPGPELINVSAVEVGNGDAGLDGGDVLLFEFDMETEAAATDPVDIFDVIDGSWGSATHVATWTNDNHVLAVTLGGGPLAGRAEFTPGVTRFQVKRTALVRERAEPESKPSTSRSPRLAGNFATKLCPIGSRFLALQIGATCYACPAGTFWRTTTSDRGVAGMECVDCPGGTFTNAEGLTACTDCAPGRYLPSTASDKTQCVAASIGTFVAEAGEDSAVLCPVDSVQETEEQTSCYGCPTNSTCNGGTTPNGIVLAGHQAIPLAEHFRQSPTYFPRCAVPQLCYAHGWCKAGHQSPELGCYECEDGWSRWESMLRHRSECFECPPIGVSAAAVALVFAFAVGLAVFLAGLGFTIAFRSECLHLFMIKILFNHLAMMHVFTSFEIWELKDGFGDLAEPVRHLLSALFTWDGSVPVYAIPLRCFIKDISDDANEDAREIDRLWVELLIWALLPITLPLLCALLGLLYAETYVLCSACLRRCQGETREEQEELSDVMPSTGLPRAGSQQSIGSRYSGMSKSSTGSGASGSWDVDIHEERLLGIWRFSPKMSWKKRMRRFLEDTSAICIATSMLIYAPTVRQLLTFLQCGAITGKPESDLRLLVAPQVVCGKDDDYNSITIVAWAALLLWGVGLPIFSALWLWRSQSTWATYSTRCKVALLGTDFHPSYFFWESVTRLRLFAVILAGSVTTNVPRTMMLGMLLTVGLVFLAVHAIHLPFDNRSGQLLDRIEENNLGIFCAMCAAMLLGYADILTEGIAFTAVLLVWLVDVLYILWSLWLIWEQSRRSMADSLIEAKLSRWKKPSMFAVSTHCWDKVREWAFHLEMQAEAKRAMVTYDPKTNSVKLMPGSAGKPVRDSERTALVQGLVDCIEHAVIDAKVESLSVYLIEYIMRHAFAVHYVRVCNEGELRTAIKAKRRNSRSGTFEQVARVPEGDSFSPLHAEGTDPESGTDGPAGREGQRGITFDEEQQPEPSPTLTSERALPTSKSMVSKATRESKVSMAGLMKVTKVWLFKDEPFAHGMPLIDIQAVLIKFLSFSKHGLESHYFQFMRRRGAKNEYKLTPRDRIFQKVGLEKPKHHKARDARMLQDADPTMAILEKPPQEREVAFADEAQAASVPEDATLRTADRAVEEHVPEGEALLGQAPLEDEDLPEEAVLSRLDRSRGALGDFDPPADGKPRHSLSEKLESAMGLNIAEPSTEAPLKVTRSGVASGQNNRGVLG